MPSRSSLEKTAGSASAASSSSSSSIPPYEVQYPEYGDVESRVKSFVGWPGQVVGQNPRKMAVCGLFYIGSADRVRCFSCGTTLRNWQPHNDPRDVHLSFAPQCTFIRALTKTPPTSLEVDGPSSGGRSETGTSGGGVAGTEVRTTTSASAGDKGTSGGTVRAKEVRTATSGGNVRATEVRTFAASGGDGRRTSGGVPPRNGVQGASGGNGSRGSSGQQGGGAGDGITSPGWELSSPAVQAVLEMGVARQTVEATLRELSKSRGLSATPLSAVDLYSACLPATVS